jgi:CubicO group peptidase (beta-lactamase class C family)
VSLAALLQEGVEQRLFSGAAASVSGEIATAGTFTYDAASRPVDSTVLWDVASLTKIVATTTLAMTAAERGMIDLDDPATKHWPEFRHGNITIRQLLLHRSGLPPYLELWRDCRTPEEAEAKLIAAEPRHAIPPRTIYSCTGFLVLRKVLESVYQGGFAQVFRSEVASPLGLQTTFNPLSPDDCVPTARPAAWRPETGPYLQGVVHDPAAFILGGVSGNAGLFASLDDLVKWSDALVHERLVKPETLARFTKRHDAWSTRALGFDTRVPGARGWSTESFGHTGYTGTSLWIDPKAKRTAILLTNRVHPDDTVELKAFRVRFHEAASRL